MSEKIHGRTVRIFLDCDTVGGFLRHWRICLLRWSEHKFRLNSMRGCSKRFQGSLRAKPRLLPTGPQWKVSHFHDVID